MGEQTGISWCHHTFNPWIGCTKVSPACDGCYAEAMMGEAGRYKRVVWGKPGTGAGTRSRTSPANWKQPLKWDRAAAAAGEPRFVFCASLADVFDNAVPVAWRTDLFDLIRATPNLTWLLLTKRPQMILKLAGLGERARGDAEGTIWPRNAAIGTTIEDQTRADQNIPALLAAKAALKPAFAFLSMEPLLGPVDIRPWLPTFDHCPEEGEVVPAHLRIDGQEACQGCTGRALHPLDDCRAIWTPGVDWVITGGETDQGAHKARPTHPDWLRSIRDRCAAAGVPYHHKQNGEWAPADAIGIVEDGPLAYANGHVPDWMDRAVRFADGSQDRLRGHTFTGHGTNLVYRVGKKRSGRLLDGVLHDSMPEVRS